MLILKRVKVVYFDTLLQVLILKGLILHQNKLLLPFFGQVLILNGFKSFRMNTSMSSVSVDSKGAYIAPKLCTFCEGWMGTGENRISCSCTQKLLYQRNMGLSRGISLD